MIIWMSQMIVPLIIFGMLGMGILGKRPVFDDFLAGARDGMRTVAEVLPTLIGLMTAVGVLRASGLLDVLGNLLALPAGWLCLPAELVPLTLVRLVSNSAATGLLLDIFGKYGPDSFLGMAGSIMMSCTETVFYCISIYFGSVKVTKTRYVIPGALFATAAGVAASIWLAGR
ncbi:MAG: spore maturation protein [Lachnospiraceae bacterium]|nr:spore maturation protein [Lachnospiraceae bacterium]